MVKIGKKIEFLKMFCKAWQILGFWGCSIVEEKKILLSILSISSVSEQSLSHPLKDQRSGGGLARHTDHTFHVCLCVCWAWHNNCFHYCLICRLSLRLIAYLFIPWNVKKSAKNAHPSPISPMWRLQIASIVQTTAHTKTSLLLS